VIVVEVAKLHPDGIPDGRLRLIPNLHHRRGFYRCAGRFIRTLEQNRRRVRVFATSAERRLGLSTFRGSDNEHRLIEQLGVEPSVAQPRTGAAETAGAAATTRVIVTRAGSRACGHFRQVGSIALPTGRSLNAIP